MLWILLEFSHSDYARRGKWGRYATCGCQTSWRGYAYGLSHARASAEGFICSRPLTCCAARG